MHASPAEKQQHYGDSAGLHLDCHYNSGRQSGNLDSFDPSVTWMRVALITMAIMT
jgi:hypothetical protein